MSDRRFFGKYRAVVLDTADPMKLARVRVQVASVTGNAEIWAMPCVPFAEINSGEIALPREGSTIWVEFEQGNADLPIWVGGILR